MSRDATASIRDRRVALFALDLVAIGGAVVFVMLLRSGLRSYDPLSLSRLTDTVAEALPVCILTVPVALALCGRYSTRTGARETRRAATASLLAAAVVSVWTLREHQTWWLFLPAAGALVWTVALALSARLIAGEDRSPAAPVEHTSS
ncbi:MAG: hypothetical protein HZB14_09330 [Actinobacteria bacterium]|nr:hypothetical protein [Actinomycetota bacterium]